MRLVLAPPPPDPSTRSPLRCQPRQPAPSQQHASILLPALFRLPRLTPTISNLFRPITTMSRWPKPLRSAPDLPALPLCARPLSRIPQLHRTVDSYDLLRFELTRMALQPVLRLVPPWSRAEQVPQVRQAACLPPRRAHRPHLCRLARPSQRPALPFPVAASAQQHPARLRRVLQRSSPLRHLPPARERPPTEMACHPNERPRLWRLALRLRATSADREAPCQRRAPAR